MEWNTNLQKKRNGNEMEIEWRSNGYGYTYIHGIFGKVYFRLDIFLDWQFGAVLS